MNTEFCKELLTHATNYNLPHVIILLKSKSKSQVKLGYIIVRSKA